jgi:dipeptidyl aminopeptidase/acylaminoacyl peptidase
LTFRTAPDSADYDASWSPLGTELVFQRHDKVIYRKPVPWLGTTETEIIRFTSGNTTHPAISPDGKTVAYVRLPPGGDVGFIYTIPISGGTPKQITSNSAADDRYPEWSPDGRLLVFERRIVATGAVHLYKVAPGDASPTAIPFYTPSSAKAVLPSYVPDSLIIAAGQGPSAITTVPATVETAPPPGSFEAITANYPQYTYALLSSQMSPDGTRMGLLAKDPKVAGALSAQTWAARRNMNLPPIFTTATDPFHGTISLAETTVVVNLRVDPYESSDITVLASDSEGDVRTYRAHFLQSWMVWSATNRTLTCTASPADIGKTFYVKFVATTPSGGTDSFIGAILVGATGGLSLQEEAVDGTALDGPNPTRGAFAVTAPTVRGSSATLSIYDAAGRRVAQIRGRSGAKLVWSGKNSSGMLVQPGIYLYRMEIGKQRREGKIVVVR